MANYLSENTRRILWTVFLAVIYTLTTFAILNLLSRLQIGTALDRLISVPGAAFIFLFGAFLPLPDPKEDLEDEKQRRKISRQRARNALLRIIFMIMGGVGLSVGLFTRLGDLQDSQAMVAIAILYTFLIFFVQRAERNRRIATLIFMAFCGFVIGRYTVYRGYTNEENWAVYLALAVNYIFWLLVGQHYPPADSSQIEVWGMDE